MWNCPLSRKRADCFSRGTGYRKNVSVELFTNTVTPYPVHTIGPFELWTFRTSCKLSGVKHLSVVHLLFYLFMLHLKLAAISLNTSGQLIQVIRYTDPALATPVQLHLSLEVSMASKCGLEGYRRSGAVYIRWLYIVENNIYLVNSLVNRASYEYRISEIADGLTWRGTFIMLHKQKSPVFRFMFLKY